MDLPVNQFKKAILSGKAQIGIWSSLCSAISAEVLADAGFDWVLLDSEHSPNELPIVQNQLDAMLAGTTEPIVRPAWNDTVLIKRFLDVGARTLLIPYVQNVEEAKRAVAATRYPPQGVRGVSGCTRANRYGHNGWLACNPTRRAHPAADNVSQPPHVWLLQRSEHTGSTACARRHRGSA